MTKYSLETKLAAVNAYINSSDSFKVTAQKHNVSTTRLKNWVAKYREHGVAAFEKSYTNYSIEFKMDVLDFIAETGASVEQATSLFNIGAPTTVFKWKSLLETHGINALQSKAKGRSSMKKESKNQSGKETDKTLQSENERLRAENAYLKKLQALIQEKKKLRIKIKHKSLMN